MTDLLRDRATISVAAGQVWRLLDDPDALRRVLPGAESLVADGDGRLRCVLATRIQFLTIRADVAATIGERDAPRHFLLSLQGRPRGLVGSFHAIIPVDLTPLDGPEGPATRTAVAYSVRLEVTGRLAAFGAPLLRDTMRRQVAQLVSNVERELAAREESIDASGARSGREEINQ